MRDLKQEDFNLKIIKDLGMEYTSDTKKHKARFAIFECPHCLTEFRTQTTSVKNGNTTKCNVCARKMAGVNHQVFDKEFPTLYNKYLRLRQESRIDIEQWGYLKFKTYILSLGYNEGLFIHFKDKTKSFSEDNIFISDIIQKSKPLKDINFKKIYPNFIEVVSNGSPREIKLLCECGNTFTKIYRSSDKKDKVKKCGSCLTKDKALHFEQGDFIGTYGITFIAESKLGNGFSIMKCGVCSNQFEGLHSYYNKDAIKSCGCNSGSSFLEREVISFIENLNIPFSKNDRSIISPKEVDIFIPSIKLAIEFNGLYWHSELAGKDNKYHATKTELCNKLGVEVLHIFEHQWILHQDIIKDIIYKKLNKSKKIYARQCVIQDVKAKDAETFLMENHIQGYVSSKYNIGLYLDKELVSIMTLGNSRFNKNYDYELHRFANKLGITVIGGAAKLLKHFRNLNSGSIISYCDLSLFTGKVYSSLGFTLTHKSKPNYWYFKDIQVYNRVKFQKHKLKGLLDTFDENLTEWENMVNNGWNRYWDCGNAVFVLE